MKSIKHDALRHPFDGGRSNIRSNRYTAGSGSGTATLIETDNAGSAFLPQIAPRSPWTPTVR